jgi:processive 1,2-diacylglycerol beta-glucosyltransferase
MTGKRILLMHISAGSGHCQASKAIEAALRSADPSSRIVNVDCLNYMNPVLGRIISHTYLRILKTAPEIWDYLYDNQSVADKVRKLRDLIHRYNSIKLRSLLEQFRPDVVACTQAFPCGMVADYKKTFTRGIPLVGVLTDYFPHLYWPDNMVDYYVVADEETKGCLEKNGIDGAKIRVFGIPIDPGFARRQDPCRLKEEMGLDGTIPVVLVMGGSRGMGPIRETIRSLNGLNSEFQLVVVAGLNRSLKKELEREAAHFSVKTRVFGFAENMSDLMEAASVIVTKPGGLTTAEALSKGLPIIIVNPLPGQEAKNTQFLLKRGVARQVGVSGLKDEVEKLLACPELYGEIRRRAKELAKTDSAVATAELLMSL